MGPADGVGEGLWLRVGIGDGLSEEPAVALELAEGDGLLCVAAFEFEHPATASKAAIAARRTPTGI